MLWVNSPRFNNSSSWIASSSNLPTVALISDTSILPVLVIFEINAFTEIINKARGAAKAREELAGGDVMTNDCYKYAVARRILNNQGCNAAQRKIIPCWGNPYTVRSYVFRT